MSPILLVAFGGLLTFLLAAYTKASEHRRSLPNLRINGSPAQRFYDLWKSELNWLFHVNKRLKWLFFASLISLVFALISGSLLIFEVERAGVVPANSHSETNIALRIAKAPAVILVKPRGEIEELHVAEQSFLLPVVEGHIGIPLRMKAGDLAYVTIGQTLVGIHKLHVVGFFFVVSTMLVIAYNFAVARAQEPSLSDPPAPTAQPGG